jgi:uncharacterized membrane protein YphA (DoxX/SURF4 family)
MAGAATVAAALLAMTLGLAAWAKATRQQSTARAFEALGVPAPRTLAVLVPLAEIAVAGGLLVRPGPAGFVALVLLGAFSVVVVRALARDLRVPCGCFGTTDSDASVSRVDLLRNGMLGALAVLATGAARPTRPSVAATVTVLGASSVGIGLLAWARRRWSRS